MIDTELLFIITNATVIGAFMLYMLYHPNGRIRTMDIALIAIIANVVVVSAFILYILYHAK